jgi:hypothetical protein
VYKLLVFKCRLNHTHSAQRKVSLRVLRHLHDGDNAVQDASWRCTDPARDAQLCSTDSRACTHCLALTLHSVSRHEISLTLARSAPTHGDRDGHRARISCPRAGVRPSGPWSNDGDKSKQGTCSTRSRHPSEDPPTKVPRKGQAIFAPLREISR